MSSRSLHSDVFCDLLQRPLQVFLVASDHVARQPLAMSRAGYRGDHWMCSATESRQSFMHTFFIVL